MMVQINPILMKIGDNFVAKHTQEEVYHDRAESFALLTAMCWKTDPEPLSMGPKWLVKYLKMPEDLAQRFSAFLKTQTYLLKQLERCEISDYYGRETEPEMGNPTYESIVSAVESRMWGEGACDDAEKQSLGDWWWEGMNWPPFTFVVYVPHQAINKWKLF